jgi:tetratricopeptide (TPR) repeat protein
VAHADLGRALRQLRRHAEAEASIRKAIEHSADKTLYQDELGRTLASLGKLEEALAVAEELIRSRPKAEQSGMDLRVAVFAIAGKRESALKSLQALLDKHPECHAIAAMGQELEEFRKLPAAQDLIRKARAKTRK